MRLSSRGFTLLEILVAMAIGSVLLLTAARFLPMLQQQNLRLLVQVQLQEELLQIMHRLEKALRRAGYCHGECVGNALEIRAPAGDCLLLRWDESSSGRWRGPAAAESDFYGYRLREEKLEMQRGVASCDGRNWESLSDPRVLGISDFRVQRQHQQIRITIGGFARQWPQVTYRLEHWLTAENL